MACLRLSPGNPADCGTAALTVQQAAALVGCSTKTLYRHMNRGTLPFHYGSDRRRYFRQQDLRCLIAAHRRPSAGSVDRVLFDLQTQLEEVKTLLHRQGRLLEQAIALYEPRTFADLAKKHTDGR